MSPVRDEAGKLIGLSVIDRDITAQKQASQYARMTDENLRFLAAIVQSSEDAVISEALDGTITSWNPAAEKMFGYVEKEALGKPMSIIGTPDRVQEFDAIIDQVKRGIKVERYETQRKRKNGSVVDVLVTVSAVRNKDGKLKGTIRYSQGSLFYVKGTLRVQLTPEIIAQIWNGKVPYQLDRDAIERFGEMMKSELRNSLRSRIDSFEAYFQQLHTKQSPNSP